MTAQATTPGPSTPHEQTNKGRMSKTSRRQSILARASVSPKGGNQDASVALHHDVPGYSLMVVADGIGSHPGAEVGARLAVETAAELFRKADPRRLDPRLLFSGAADALGKRAARRIGSIVY